MSFYENVASVRTEPPAGLEQGAVADGYAHHRYQWTTAPATPYRGRGGADNAPISELSRLTRALSRFAQIGALRTSNGRALDLYLTEFGYFASGSRRLPQRLRARYLPEAFAIALHNSRVRSMLQYLLVNGLVPPPSRPGF